MIKTNPRTTRRRRIAKTIQCKRHSTKRQMRLKYGKGKGRLIYSVWTHLIVILIRNNAKNETSNIEHVLQHHRQMHDELTTDLGRMAKQLKINSQAFGDTLSKDDVVLKEAQQAVESNLTRMTKERQRLDVHYSKSWGTSFMTMAVVLFVCIMFVLVFFTIKFLPKAT